MSDDDLRDVAIETIGEPIPEKAEHLSGDELFIRLHLNYVRYAALERLAEAGVETLRARVKELQALGSEPPAPLTDRDIRVVVGLAQDDLRDAEALVKTIKRPPPKRDW